MLEFEFHSTDLKVTKEQIEKYEKVRSFYQDSGVLFKSIHDKSYEQSKDQECYKSYHEIVKRVADLCEKLDSVDHPLLISLIFEYLLWGGYLSKDHRYAYDMRNRVNNFACVGADIMRGHGVCLNNADMLANIYQELGYEAYTMGISVNKSVEKLDIWKPDIKRNIDNNSRMFNLFSMSKLINRLGNHAITMVKNDVYELYDPTSLSVLKPTDALQASYIGTGCGFDLKLWITIVLSGLWEDENHTQVSDITKMLFYQGVEDVNNLLPFDDYKEICNRMVSCLGKAEPLLNDLYEKNKKDIDIVVRSLSNGRGRKRG